LAFVLDTLEYLLVFVTIVTAQQSSVHSKQTEDLYIYEQSKENIMADTVGKVMFLSLCVLVVLGLDSPTRNGLCVMHLSIDEQMDEASNG
jgi:hypothetical protein